MDGVRITVRLPVDLVGFLDRQVKENFTSRNAEVIRSIKERMVRTEKEKGDAPA